MYVVDNKFPSVYYEYVFNIFLGKGGEMYAKI
jgi:hypothetical protein